MADPSERARPALVLLDGFAASTWSWREVMASLAEQGTVAAFDRPGFGLTERPLPGEWEGRSPYGVVEKQPAYHPERMRALGAD